MQPPDGTTLRAAISVLRNALKRHQYVTTHRGARAELTAAELRKHEITIGRLEQAVRFLESLVRSGRRAR